MAVHISTKEEQRDSTTAAVLWLCLALALVAAVAYALGGLGVLPPGDLKPGESPPGIAYVAAACYALGGLLILLRRRWLWIVGAAINALVIATFAVFYIGRPAVMFSTIGLVTKTAQILLEAGLIYLISAASTSKSSTKQG